MAMPYYAKYVICLAVLIGLCFIFIGVQSLYSDYVILSTWRPVNATVTHFDENAISNCDTHGSCSHIVNMTYAYPYNENQYSGHCCSSDVAPSTIQFVGEVGGTTNANTGESEIGILVNPDAPDQSRLASTLFTTQSGYILIGFIIPIAVLLFFVLSAEAKKSKDTAASSIEPVLQKNGFAKVATGWDGAYRGRDFNIQLFTPSGLGQSVGLSIKTPNRSGRDPKMIFDSKERMVAAGLEDIYQRIDKLGMYSILWRSTRFDGQWALFNITNERAAYILPGSILNEETFKESLEIICDTLDRLSV